jgi:RNA polymerase sigma-70 factor (ECF subfamily)
MRDESGDVTPAGATGAPRSATKRAISDQGLILRIAGGDKRAMQVLFARHHVRVFRFVLGLIEDASIAEDIVGEVFLDVWRQADRFQAHAEVSTWLLAMARRKAVAALRWRPRPTGAEVHAIEDPADDPVLAMDNEDRGEALRTRLAALPPDRREIIDLVYYHGKSIDAAAEILEIPAPAVKTRMFDARKRLPKGQPTDLQHALSAGRKPTGRLGILGRMHSVRTVALLLTGRG